MHVEKICSLPNHCAAEHVGCHDTDVENEIVSISPEHSTRDLFDVLQDKMATYTVDSVISPKANSSPTGNIIYINNGSKLYFIL